MVLQVAMANSRLSRACGGTGNECTVIINRLSKCKNANEVAVVTISRVKTKFISILHWTANLQFLSAKVAHSLAHVRLVHPLTSLS